MLVGASLDDFMNTKRFIRRVGDESFSKSDCFTFTDEKLRFSDRHKQRAPISPEENCKVLHLKHGQGRSGRCALWRARAVIFHVPQKYTDDPLGIINLRKVKETANIGAQKNK